MSASFIDELRRELPSSTSDDRRALAARVVREKIHLPGLLILLGEEEPVCSRFAWMLSDVAEQDPEVLGAVLPAIFDMRHEIKARGWERSLAKWWHLCGLPEENEGEAADLLFSWMQNPELNVSTKHHCLETLMQLVRRFPDLKGELELVLGEQRTQYSAAFRKKVDRALLELAAIK